MEENLFSIFSLNPSSSRKYEELNLKDTEVLLDKEEQLGLKQVKVENFFGFT